MNIIEKRKWFFAFSGTLVAASAMALIIFGLKPSIDFTGGSLLEVVFIGGRPEKQVVESTVKESGFETVLVQPVDDDGYLIKMRFITEEDHQQLLGSLREQFESGEEHKVLEKRLDTIGPAISAQLKKRAMEAGIVVALAIIAYIAYAFRKVSRPVSSWKYGVAAVVALIHDVGITMGVFAVLGKYMGVEVDIPFVVALLTVLGYSVNDTIVVFDRTRENLIHLGSDRFEEAVSTGVRSTIARSINTSSTTLLTLFALFLFGGETIRYFSLALIIGISFGTYSSIFLASPLLVSWHRWSSKR